MKLTWASSLVVLLAAESTVASTWFSKAVYNKWHENELERWLSDHDVPYPTPADRKDLQDLVKSNWQAAVESPYVNWDTTRLQKQLQTQGAQVKKGTEKNKDALIKQVQGTWSETTKSADDAYSSVKDWIFDSWTDSQLKAFADKHGIPVPQPRQRDTLIKSIRENYQTVANKANEATYYPSNWLWATWSDSDLKSFLDERGIPVPQSGKRDKLVARVRRNSRVASINYQQALQQVSDSANTAYDDVTNKLLDSWSDSQIKEWADKHDINVPQGSTRNELIAIARKHSAKLSAEAEKASASASASIGAATSSAGNEYAKATASAEGYGNQVYSQVLHYYNEAQVALGIKKDPASSASKAAASASKSMSSAYKEASKSAKGEL